MIPQYPQSIPDHPKKFRFFDPRGLLEAEGRPVYGFKVGYFGLILINSAGNGVRQAIALTIFMNIVRAFPCLTPFPAEFFRILTPGASWRPKADRFFLTNTDL